MLRLASGERAKGTIKSEPEDFVVEEIIPNGSILERDKKYTSEDLGLASETEGKFSIFVLQKKDWNTAQALKNVARRFRRGVKSTSFAGTKDRTSISTQLCSLFGVTPEQLMTSHIKDITINGAWLGNEKIKMGDLLGNRFTITIKDIEGYEKIQSIMSQLGGIFPNYYGEQRFGNRKINFDIGIDILKGDFKGAALKYLTETQYETSEDAKQAREKLASELDFKDALQYFPGYLKYELSMIDYLAKYPNNYANAIRSLPRSISLMFVHSVESQIFNMELEERIKEKRIHPEESDLVCKEGKNGFPDIESVGHLGESEGKSFLVGNIIGFDTIELTAFEKDALEQLGLTLDSFKVDGLGELRSRGSMRALFAPFKDMDWKYDQENNSSTARFSLPSGSYATILMDEFIEMV